MPYISVRDEYAPQFGRQVLTLWSGGFCSDYEGRAVELPNHDGFMVTLEYETPIRVACESPRTAENYERVDDAIRAALASM
jgi:hypothetical protein